MTHDASVYQSAIYDWVKRGRGDGIVDAVAGSGKSYTLGETIKLLPGASAIMLAFNTTIVGEFKARFGANIPCKTFNQLGHSAIGIALGRNVKIAFDEYKYDKIVDQLTGYVLERSEDSFTDARKAILELTRLTMSSLTDPTDLGALIALADHYGVELPPSITDQDVQHVVRKSLVEGIAMGRKGIISYEDHTYLPVKLNWRPRPAQFVLIDEAQDLSPAKFALALLARAPGGRVLAVGDKFQAIYGFSGASADMFDRIEKQLHATRLPLSICYRCPSSVLDLVKGIVPHLEVRPDAPAGEVVTIAPDKIIETAQVGDLILSRKNAPLIRLCVKFIRARMPARVKGRAIGNGLIALAKTALGHQPWDRVEEALTAYLNRRTFELGQREGGERHIEDLMDRVECVRAIIEAYPCTSIDDLANAIDELFSDGKSAIELSSVHRAKGLEADRVFIIEPESMPLTWKGQQAWELEQEWNLRYVACTRFKKSLFIAGSFVAQPVQPALPIAETADAGKTAELPAAPVAIAQTRSDAERRVHEAIVSVMTELHYIADVSPTQIADLVIARVWDAHRAAKAASTPVAPAAPERFSCRCSVCDASFISETRERVCRACGARAVIVLAIKGKHSDAACTATCQNATGHECVCSCAGRRHGERWMTGYTQDAAAS